MERMYQKGQKMPWKGFKWSNFGYQNQQYQLIIESNLLNTTENHIDINEWKFNEKSGIDIASKDHITK